jgi:hypothetical protein
MKSTLRFGVGLLSAALSFTVVGSVRADVVTYWNVVATTAATVPFVGGAPQTRLDAMTHAAIHDALNAINRRYRPYALDVHADPNASPEAAVAAAAHDVLVHELPTIRQRLSKQPTRTRSLVSRTGRLRTRGSQSAKPQPRRSSPCGRLTVHKPRCRTPPEADQACGSRRRPTFSPRAFPGGGR